MKKVNSLAKLPGGGDASLYPTRRQFVVGLGAVAASAYLVACGGGSGGGGSSARPSVAGVDRTKLATGFTDRVNQFSQTTDNIGSIWDGSSASIAALAAFSAAQPKAAFRSVDANTALMLEATWFALSGLRAGYERLANGLLAQDDQGFVAGSLDQTYSLTLGAGLGNPQWLAALMLQTYSAIRVTGGIARMLQISGVETMQAWVAAQPSDAAKLVAYGLFADLYNSWLDTVQATIGTPSVASLKLNVTNSVTAATVATTSAGASSQLGALPLGFGLRAGGAISGPHDDTAVAGNPASNFGMSFLGTASKIFLTTGSLSSGFPTSVGGLTPSYNLKTRLGKTGLFATISKAAGGDAAAQTLTNTLIADLFANGLPGANKSTAKYTTALAAEAYGLIVSFANVILSDHSLVGSAIAGNQALALLNSEISLIETSGTKAQNDILNSLECDIETLRASHVYSGNSVVLRTIPITNPGNTETDQIRSETLACGSCLMYPVADAGWNGKPGDGTISLFRNIVAGLNVTVAPRTFKNAEVAGAGLMLDLILRYSALLKPDVLTTGTFIFCVSDLARLLRRSPGVTSAQLPSISNAVLLCSAPGFAPNHWPPIDLSTSTGLDPLLPVSTLVSGVPIHVY